MLNLDTHILVHALAGDLTDRERRLLSENVWTMSAIVPWELGRLVRQGRLDLDMDDPEVIRIISAIQSWPVDMGVCRATTRLDFKGDVADEIIAATSIVNRVPLLTRDREIRRSRVVPLA